MSSTQPALYGHCEQVFAEMDARATLQEIDGQEAKVYTGHLTKLFEDLRLSVPYFSSVMNQLKGMDCVRQLRRGGGSAPSVWLIVQPPSIDMFEAGREPSKAQARTGRLDVLEQQVRDLAKRIQALEDIHSDELEPIL